MVSFFGGEGSAAPVARTGLVALKHDLQEEGGGRRGGGRRGRGEEGGGWGRGEEW